MPILLKFVTIMMTIFLFAGCSQSAKGAKEASTEVIKLLNVKNYSEVWKRTTSTSKVKLTDILTNIKSAPNMKAMAAKTLGIQTDKMDTLTAEEYFIASMNGDKRPEKVELVKVEEQGDIARVTTKRGTSQGILTFRKENGKWMLDMAFEERER